MFTRIIMMLSLLVIACSASATRIHDGWDDIAPVIGRVAYESGVDATLLAAVGAIESGFRPAVRAQGGKTTATGLYQFTNRTWRVTLKSYGELYGLDENASRLNPYANTAMGAEYLKENQRIVESRLGRKATDVELYASHLISPQRVVALSRMSGNVKMAHLYPKLAKYNYNLFYRNGYALTKNEFYRHLKGKLHTEYRRYQDLAEDAVEAYAQLVKDRMWNKATAGLNPFDCNANEEVRVYKNAIVDNFANNLDYSMSTMLLTRYSSLSTNVPLDKDGTTTAILFYDRRLYIC